MRPSAVALLVLVVLAACGGSSRTATDQNADARLLAGALGSADSSGATFTYSETVALVVQGQSGTIQTRADGSLKAGRVTMRYRLVQGTNSINYQFVIADAVLYVRDGRTGGWRSAPAASATDLFPSVLLPLLREVVLLARSVSASSLQHVASGFTHRYRVAPAPDQVEQLAAVTVTGAEETAFLKASRASVDVFLTTPADRLSRVEVHISETPSGTRDRRKTDASADFKMSTRVAAITPPSGATPVTSLSQILNL